MANHSKITIVRASHSESYTKVSNRILQNEIGLPIEARVILLDLLSRPRDWEISIEHLCKTHGLGRDRCYRALGELREAGFARLDTPRDPETGRVGKRRWLIFEEPESRFPENQETGATGFLISPVSGNHRFPENQDAYKEKNNKQTKESPTKAAALSAAAREGGEGLCDDGEPASAPAQPDAWDRFKADWPWQDGQSESVDAAYRAFDRLSDADKELCAKGAAAFQPRPGRVCAAVFIRERHWAFTRRAAPPPALGARASASISKAQRKPDGTWWLPPDSLQLQSWHAYERRECGKARMGCTRPAEWPPSHAPAAMEVEPCRGIRHG